MKELILAGWVTAGMTPEMVLAALGEPMRISGEHDGHWSMTYASRPWLNGARLEFQSGSLQGNFVGTMR